MKLFILYIYFINTFKVILKNNNKTNSTKKNKLQPRRRRARPEKTKTDKPATRPRPGKLPNLPPPQNHHPPHRQPQPHPPPNKKAYHSAGFFIPSTKPTLSLFQGATRLSVSKAVGFDKLNLLPKFESRPSP